MLKKSVHLSSPFNLSILVIVFFSCAGSLPSEGIQNERGETLIQENLSKKNLSTLCKKYEDLNNKIRDNEIIEELALSKIQLLIPEIHFEYYRSGSKSWPESLWIFPVQGYSINDIGGKDGNGYQPSGYNFFDGNKHFGHPAHDIFIIDRDQDCKDDINNEYVNILSFSGGVVVAIEKEWYNMSNLRGGKYVWIYDPYSSSLFYYSHNYEIFVTNGQIIAPGDTIATMGRTGLNAFKARSPTHLHFMQLKFDDNFFPAPIDAYDVLISAYNRNSK